MTNNKQNRKNSNNYIIMKFNFMTLMKKQKHNKKYSNKKKNKNNQNKNNSTNTLTLNNKAKNAQEILTEHI